MDGLATQAGMVRRGGFDADAAAYFAAIASAGSSISAANKTAVNDFVVGCKADGIWTAIKACCLLAGPDDLTGALVPLVGTAPTNFNFVSGDYSRTTGLQGDGSTKYLGANRNNATDPQNSYHVAIWASAVGTTGYGAGAGTTQANAMNLGVASAVYRCRGVSTAYQPGSATGAGMVGMARASSANYTTRRNGTDVVTTDASASPLSNETRIFSRGAAGATAFSDARISFYSIGEALDLSLLDTRLTTYMAALT